MKVHAGVTVWLRDQFHLKLKVLEVRPMHRPGVKQMRTRAVCGQHAIRYRPRTLVFAGLPALQTVAVE